MESIYEIFEVDFYSIPDESFTKNDIQDEESMTKFNKKLDEKILGLFDSIEVFVANDGQKNFIFHGYDFRYESDCYDDLGDLIDTIADIYGEDMVGKGEWDSEEKWDIESGTWDGRMYLGDDYEVPLLLSVNSEEGLTLAFTSWVFPR